MFLLGTFVGGPTSLYGGTELLYYLLLTLLEPQSRFGDKAVKFQVVCPQNGTAVLKGSSPLLCPQPLPLSRFTELPHACLLQRA